jgi:hypothetical protein
VPLSAQTSPGLNKTGITPEKKNNLARAEAELTLLRERLKSEGETELLSKLAICQVPITLKCTACGARKECRQQCKRKWCPSCARQLAAVRAMELEYIVERMRRPLFVTLTMRNVSTISSADVRKLRRAFGKLRHRKLWKSRTRGGVAAVEITNEGNGWHPHLHAVIDCQWLAWKTPPPPYRATPEIKKDHYKRAAQELEKTWSKLLGQETSSIRVKRANKTTIAKEIVKYTVKNEDLVTAEGSAGDLIRALESTRLMTTFGTAHGQCICNIRRDANAEMKRKRAEWREALSETNCCPIHELLPESVADSVEIKRMTQMGPVAAYSLR